MKIKLNQNHVSSALKVERVSDNQFPVTTSIWVQWPVLSFLAA